MQLWQTLSSHRRQNDMHSSQKSRPHAVQQCTASSLIE